VIGLRRNASPGALWISNALVTFMKIMMEAD
jgi:hypothetical protein